ncbi:alpha-E domain-containing protein [Alteribacillus sp. HJP-4]|uniref:alpha-E domain-containing protein n=1 Tax=Alteribacillus sp. HJP-4 TaxID=2775394 RepID=UPI0035CCF31E
MLSRVADSLYWMGRNIERAENNARVVSIRLINMLEVSDGEMYSDRDWEEVIEICSSLTEYHLLYHTLDTDSIIQYLSFSDHNLNSISNCVTYARENAKSSRETLPEELWESLNECYWLVKDLNRIDWSIREVHSFLYHIKQLSFTSQGIIESCMPRDVPHAFIQIGKWLERAEKTARILNVISEKTFLIDDKKTADNYYYWLAALQFVNGFDAYLKQYPPVMTAPQVLQFLIGEKVFPRSIRYCIDHVMAAVRDIEDGKVSHYSEELFDAMNRLDQEFQSIDFQKVSQEELKSFLDRFQNHCNEIGSIFSRTYYLLDPAAGSL